jgi:hypothetical protein
LESNAITFAQIGLRIAQKYDFLLKSVAMIFTQIGLRIAQKYDFQFIFENIS